MVPLNSLILLLLLLLRHQLQAMPDHIYIDRASTSSPSFLDNYFPFIIFITLLDFNTIQIL